MRFLFAAVLFACPAIAAAAEPVRLGVIGLDNYHTVAFAQLWNSPKAEGDLAGVRCVAAFAAPPSADIEESVVSQPKWVVQIKAFGVEVVPTLDELLKRVDVVAVCNLDGRVHLKYVREVAKAGKPFFVDRPMAASLVDAVKIFDTARAANVACFSCSQHRFSPGFIGMRSHPEVGDVIGCDVYGGCPREPHHPDLYWHAIHGVETLCTIMGPGCQSVARVSTDAAELCTGVWADGRVGTYRGIRKGAVKYSAVVFGSKGVLPAGIYGYGVPEKGNEKPGRYMGYEGVATQIAKFAKTGKPPVTPEETLEVIAFLEAAEQSKAKGGAAVKLADVLAEARAAAGK
jgi:predicted dehydrogenase